MLKVKGHLQSMKELLYNYRLKSKLWMILIIKENNLKYWQRLSGKRNLSKLKSRWNIRKKPKMFKRITPKSTKQLSKTLKFLILPRLHKKDQRNHLLKGEAKNLHQMLKKKFLFILLLLLKDQKQEFSDSLNKAFKV